MRNLLSSLLAVRFFLWAAMVSLLPTSAMALETIFFVRPELLGGKLIKEQWYNPDGEKGDYSLYSYYEQSRLVKEQEYNSDGEKRLYSLYSYNDQGQLTKKEGYYEPNGEKLWYGLYSYNDQGQLVKQQWYTFDGEKKGYTLYTVADPLFKCRELNDIAACKELAK